MDYEKKYNKLVEAIKVLQEANSSNESIQNWINDNVLELKESDDKEDEYRIKLLKALCEDKLFKSAPNSTMYEEMKLTITWLKSIKNRVQPKQEWNKEDETTLNNILSCIKKLQDHDTVDWYLGDFLIDLKRYDPMFDWLKSLKQRIGGKK